MEDKNGDISGFGTASLENEDENNKPNTSLRDSLCIDVRMYEEASDLCPLSPKDDEGQEPQKIDEHSEQSPNTPVSEKTLARNASTYELEKFRKNALLIFNHEDIEDAPRKGTHVDVEALMNTFEKCGFEVKDNIHHDLTKKELMSKVKEFTSKDFTEYGCIAIVILTHGSTNGRLRAKDRFYSELEIIEHLKLDNRTLLAKPKLVIIQACRGTNVRPPVPVFHSGIVSNVRDTDLEPYHLPLDVDMLILHSCYVGSPAFRDEVNGTWFIQTLCETIQQLAPAHDLETIITEVKRRVAIDKYQQERGKIPNELQMCQMPVVTSTLIRKLYLNRSGEPTPANNGSELPLSALEQTLMLQRGGRQPPLPTREPCSCFLDCFKCLYDRLHKAFRPLQP